MRLRYPDQLMAATKASEINAWMTANNTAYAKSVAAGQTTAWAIPYQDLDANGVPLYPYWFVNCKVRVSGALSPAETSALYPYKTGA